MEQFIIVSGEVGDWEGLYFKGKLFKESHRITTYDIMNLLKDHYKELDGTFGKYTINQDYLETNGLLPSNFKDINKNML
ncbi:hypothetical protein FJQ98_15905 [Lysinibacillus agricola]|uniref:Uncharacterized protein n=1 Tax=Lysinibacillus agricola TaxID=2590012 RepID=A0ABX7AR62_9BACI|nr:MULTISPECIES: hypothetical protein [Lysinibacillus]KOS61568.1 hypothetical protein AN161_18450 [Lysinibacillus sp. FJAT-14222]QQP10729.1 hypothetical protein FJQ98_15905 [Lysinibacillus agricola]